MAPTATPFAIDGLLPAGMAKRTSVGRGPLPCLGGVAAALPASAPSAAAAPPATTPSVRRENRFMCLPVGDDALVEGRDDVAGRVDGARLPRDVVAEPVAREVDVP